jgi:phospholipase/carboxylesterase
MIHDYAREPLSGKRPDTLVVFMHGYGSSGHLMEQHAGNLLSALLPDAKLRFPDGPVKMGWDNHSWFELRDIADNKDFDAVRHAVQNRAPAVARELNDYISRVAAEDGIPEDRIVIAGFSMGGTMAFYTALSRDTEVAGVFALSGGALDRIPDVRSKPPVKLAAGELERQDYSGAPHAVHVNAVLQQKGFVSEVEIIPGQEHDFSPAAAALLADFVKKVAAPAIPAPRRAARMKPPSPRM